MDVLGLQSDPYSQILPSPKKTDSSNKSVKTSPGDSKTPSAGEPSSKAANDGQNSDKAKIARQVSALKETEQKVRAHEAAHMAAGGSLAGGVSYQYQVGPDGKSYIVGGEVPINISAEKTPQATVDKMSQVIRAALAPADPSAQDMAVAAQASATEQSAQVELLKEPASQTPTSGETSATLTPVRSQPGSSSPVQPKPSSPEIKTAEVIKTYIPENSSTRSKISITV